MGNRSSGGSQAFVQQVPDRACVHAIWAGSNFHIKDGTIFGAFSISKGQTHRKGIYTVKGQSDWYDDIAKRISQIKNTLSQKDCKKYKLDLLSCVAQRVDEFSSGCTECHMFQQDITSLTKDMSNLVQTADKERRKAYFKALNKVIGHLQKQHKLVTEGYYSALCMALGSGLGVAIGAAMDNIGTGMAIGVGFGIFIGALLDAKAKKEGRILCPRETTRFSKTALTLLV
ncbi:hypothetical protein ACFLTN_07405, partial [Chloroflexota bacterium]